jgi:hypothetical protein
VIAGLILIFAFGVTLVAIAWKPEYPVLRSAYWWRISSRTRPTIVERIPVAIIGVLVIAFGAYESLLLRG